MKKLEQFDIALSFASENRKYVEQVAEVLKKMGFKVFYDKYEEGAFWGEDLYDYLDEIYGKRANYTVIFISKYYASKVWTNHERKSAQAKAITENIDCILPVRFDRTEIPGIRPTVGYVDLKHRSPEQLALLIKEKIGPKTRKEFLPETFDLVLLELIELKADKNIIDHYETLTVRLFDSLKLMTSKERKLIFLMVKNCCSGGKPNNVHLSLELISRLFGAESKKIVSMLSRLSCLYINTRIYKQRVSAADKRLNKIIELTFKPLLGSYTGNATAILFSVVDCILNLYCSDCACKTMENLDLSALNSYTAFPELRNEIAKNSARQKNK